jgi:hypothetical protein
MTREGAVEAAPLPRIIFETPGYQPLTDPTAFALELTILVVEKNPP